MSSQSKMSIQFQVCVPRTLMTSILDHQSAKIWSFSYPNRGHVSVPGIYTLRSPGDARASQHTRASKILDASRSFCRRLLRQRKRPSMASCAGGNRQARSDPVSAGRGGLKTMVGEHLLSSTGGVSCSISFAKRSATRFARFTTYRCPW